MQFSETSRTSVLWDLGELSMETELEAIRTMKYQAGKQTMTGDALSRVNKEVRLRQGFLIHLVKS